MITITSLDFWSAVLGGVCALLIIGGIFVGYAAGSDVGAFWED